MTQFSYDVVAHRGGWAIMVTPKPADTFPTKQAAYDVAAEFARKLRFGGVAVNVQVDRDEPVKKAG